MPLQGSSYLQRGEEQNTVTGCLGIRAMGLQEVGDALESAGAHWATREDVQRGLFGKSAIHPRQLAVIWQSMLPCVEELEQARAIVSPSAPAVFSMHGTMLEPACHRRWAEQVLEVDRMGCVPSHVGVSETAFEFRAD